MSGHKQDCGDTVRIERQLGDVSRVSAQIAETLSDRAKLAHLGYSLPDPAKVTRVTQMALRLLFPEIWVGDPLNGETLAQTIATLHDLLHELLFAERIARPNRQGLLPAGADPCAIATENARDWAHETSLGLIELLPSVRERMETDLQAAIDGDPAARSQAEIVLCYPGFYAIATHRLAHPLWLAGAQLVARLMAERAHRRTGIDLHPAATIGPAFFIDHGTGVVVGETAVIGARVRLYQGVTLGARSVSRVTADVAAANVGAGAELLSSSKRHPTVEDDVVIYANATILGGDTVIGAGSIIGGNTWVTTSVPAGSRLRLDLAARVADAVVMVPDGQQPE